MYCERCGKKVGLAGVTLGKCPTCGREFDLKPRWMDVVLMLLAFALVPTIAIALFAVGLRVPTAALGIAIVAAIAFRVFVTYGLVCTRCNAAYNREQAAYHAFEDSELPLDYWADHDENLALMRARGVTPEMVAAHERVLKAIGVTRPQGGDAR